MTVEAGNSQESPAPATAPKRWLDAAVVLSLASAALYALGGAYWYAFFAYFGLSVDVVGLTFQQVLSTTWWLALGLGWLLWQTLGIDLGTIRGVKEPALRIDQIELRTDRLMVLVAVTVAGVAVQLLRLPWWRYAVVSIGVVLIGSTILRFVPEKIPIGRFFRLDRSSGRLLAGVLVMFVLGGLYAGLGRWQAILAARGEVGTCITIETSTGPSPPPHLLLLTRSSGFFFLARRDSASVPKVTLMVPEATVRSAVIRACQ
jgi:hypothetical protein